MSSNWAATTRILFGLPLLLAATSCSLFISLDDITPDQDAGGGAGGTSGGGCSGGLASCGGRCVDLQTDETACGSCSKACDSGNQCIAGQCCAPAAAGGTCSLPACGCAAGRVCYPDTEQTGLACFISNNLQEGQDCSATVAVCASGTGCFGGVCKRYCTADGDCQSIEGARLCLQTVWSDATMNDIPGVLVCQRICDPVSPQSPRGPLQTCPAGFNCYATDSRPGATDCVPGGKGGLGASCTSRADCLPGYYCTRAPNSTCNKYCYTSADCAGGAQCLLFAMPEYAGAQEVGACAL